MRNYYLTEMNVLQLENTLLQFLLHNKVEPILRNGIMGKIATMMYHKHIDYYYADTLATVIKVPIKHIDNIYLNGYDKCYQKPLPELLATAAAPTSIIENAPQLEHAVAEIIQTRKPIKTRKPYKAVKKNNKLFY